jgi:hypothetical protein
MYKPVQNSNIKILLKNILSYSGYSPISPFFFLLTEHKHCDNAASISNSENARNRMVESLGGSVGSVTNEDESPYYGPFSFGAF